MSLGERDGLLYRGMSEQVNLSRKMHDWFSRQMESTRLHLARPDALIQLAVMGLITGLLAGAVIVCFRYLIEAAQNFALRGNGPDAFESLTP